MKVRTLADAQASGRCSASPDNNREPSRMLRQNDDMGFFLHSTTSYAGANFGMHYKNNLGSVYGVYELAVEELAVEEIDA